MRLFRMLIAGRLVVALALSETRVADDAGRRNAEKHPWAKHACEHLAAAAGPWLKLSDDALWDLLFANSIKRSWMVWSNGHCPACQKPVPRYEGLPAALDRPWKRQCPQGRELFPTGVVRPGAMPLRVNRADSRTTPAGPRRTALAAGC